MPRKKKRTTFRAEIELLSLNLISCIIIIFLAEGHWADLRREPEDESPTRQHWRQEMLQICSDGQFSLARTLGDQHWCGDDLFRLSSWLVANSSSVKEKQFFLHVTYVSNDSTWIVVSSSVSRFLVREYLSGYSHIILQPNRNRETEGERKKEKDRKNERTIS